MSVVLDYVVQSLCFFCFKQKTAYEMRISDWSSDVCSSDLAGADGNQDDLFSNESRRVLEVIAREAIANCADARQAFVAFVETSWDHSGLVEVPRLLQEVAGAMAMLELPQAAGYLAGVRMYTEVELLGRKRVPNDRQLDTFADALASLEYYLEALRENRLNRENILEIARGSLERSEEHTSELQSLM